MSRRLKFKDGESVLCYQGLLIYEAKIQGIKNEGNGSLYDIHYKGWNKTWDEWVVEERIMKINEENLQKQREVASEVKTKKNFAAKKTSAIDEKGIKRSNSESPDEHLEEKGSSREVSKDRDVTRPALLPRVKKLRSRSNSDASIISINSSKSVDSKKSVDSRKSETSKLIKPQVKKAPIKGTSQNKTDVIVEEDILIQEELPSRPKTRPVKPMAVLKTATDVPKSHKKSKKKKKVKEPSLGKVTKAVVKDIKAPVKKLKKGSKPKTKKSSSVPPIEEPLLRSRREFGQEITIPLSDELKAVLVDDFDYIGRQRKLLHVPSRYTVDDLINAYYEARKGVEGEAEEQILGAEEVCRGLKDYFNSTLGSQLLYKFERVQYSDTLKENAGVPMAQLYGPVHLLRLLTKLGPMLSAAEIEQDAMGKLIGHVKDFVGYMHKHRETLYQIEDYGTATPEYHRRAL